MEESRNKIEKEMEKVATSYTIICQGGVLWTLNLTKSSGC
jgi:hypothetical protein